MSPAVIAGFARPESRSPGEGNRFENVRALLMGLGQHERVVLGLRYIEGLHPAEIAQVLELPVQRVEEVLDETLRRVRKVA